MKELRCKKCNKLLGKQYNKYHVETDISVTKLHDIIKGSQYIELKCTRCKEKNKYRY